MAGPLEKSIETLKKSFHKLKREVESSAVAAGENRASNINFKGRTNIQVAKNIGQPGGTATSHSVQDAPIDQDSSI